MHWILFNLQWMGFNVFLAVIPVVFGWLMMQMKSKLLKVLYGTVWFMFLPNTIYLLTDIGHFFTDWHMIPLQYKGIFIVEYAILMVLGILTFILALSPVERFFRK